MKLFVVVLTALTFTVPPIITLDLKHAGENGIEAQNHLQSLVTEMRIQDGIEWRLINGATTSDKAQRDLEAGRERAAEHLEESANLGLSAAQEARISADATSYFQKVDREIQLIGAGARAEAKKWDESQVDPAFDEVATLLTEQAEQMETDAKSHQRSGDVGVLLTVLLSLLVVTLVQSRRKRAEVRDEAKHQGEARYRALIDQSSDLVVVLDREGRTSFLSPSAERLLAAHHQDRLTTAQEGAGMVTTDFVTAVDAQDRERFATALATATPGSMSAGEFRLTGRHGTAAFEMTIQDLTADRSVGGFVLTGHDITDRLTMQRVMEHRALHDELTGLPNRALLADRFEQALISAERAGTSVGLLLLDLDRFKEVNDTLGHHYGDELLRQIGPRLTGVLRGVDTVARLGGDEFAVLLMDIHGVGDAMEVANSLLTALAIPFHVEGVDLDVEASVGVVISGEHGQDPITLMQHADIAMYVAKGQHIGVFAYDPEVDKHSATKLAMVGDLRRGLERGELVLHYQPKVNISTGDLVGAEALVRWAHPEQGLVFPDNFIPLAERTGLINPLTRHILDIALAQARVWMDAGRPLPIAVNLSARNLHNERFAAQVAELLAVHDVPAYLLELEVTESAIMIDPARATQMLEKLAGLGIRISLDDFGAGYTSLSQLKALPITELKIDRSFILTMSNDHRDSLIVQSVIALGHNLGLTLVAEGVEDELVLATLSSLECDLAQGYLLTRPISATEFDAWSAGRTITRLPPRHLRASADEAFSVAAQPESDLPVRPPHSAVG